MASIIQTPIQHIYDASLVADGSRIPRYTKEIKTDLSHLSSVGKITMIGAGAFGLVLVPTVYGIPFVGKLLASTTLVACVGAGIVGYDFTKIAQNLHLYIESAHFGIRWVQEVREADPRKKFEKDLIRTATRNTLIVGLVV